MKSNEEALTEVATEKLYAQYAKNVFSKSALVNRVLNLEIPDSVKISLIQSAQSQQQIESVNEIVNNMAGSSQGRQVRDLRIVQTIDWLEVGKAMRDCTEKRTTSTESKPIHGETFVYFIESETSGLVKIGKSVNPASRFSAIRTMSPDKLVLIGAIPESEHSESELHTKFAHLRKHGEWFEDCAELREFLETLQLAEIN